MDLVQAARAFVNVADRGSFTRGAAAAGISQSVASRRVAALEAQYGARLLDRSGRRPILTPLGHRLLPAARRLVEAAEDLSVVAEDAQGEPLRLAVPAHWGVVEVATLRLAARDHGIELLAVRASARERPSLVGASCGASVHACLPQEGEWRVPLGLGSAVAGRRVARLEELRPGRLTAEAPTVWLLSEDDVPHVRDPLEDRALAVGLRPSQLAVAKDGAHAVADVLSSADRVLLTAAEADAFGLAWAPVEPALERGYRVSARTSLPGEEIARCLGPAIRQVLGAP